MPKHRGVDLPKVNGFDLEYRPNNYFWAADLKIPLLSSVAGENRRRILGALIKEGDAVPYGLDASVLDEELRVAWGLMFPSNMGGEYLAPLRKGEIEIARISLASVTADQISIRARRVGQRIGYRIVDEYPEFWTYACHPARSLHPLSLGELIALLESANEGGSIILPLLRMNSRYSTPAALLEFITVTSDFYNDLGPYYRALTDSWIKQHTSARANPQ